MDAEYLLWYWIGEKLVGSRGEDPTEDAYCLLGLLIGRSLIDLEDCFIFERNFKFKVHDVLRDLALYILEHNILPHKRLCLFRAGRGLTEFWLTTESERMSATRISLKEHVIATLPDQLHAPQLHTLILEGTMGNFGEAQGLTAVPRRFFTTLSNLMVLDLNTCDLKTLPESLGTLKLLVHLDLSYNTNLSKLPDSIKSLRNLKHLALKQCLALEPLPLGLTKSLTLLDAQDCSRVWTVSNSKKLTLEEMTTSFASLEDLNISDYPALPVGPYGFKNLKRVTLRRFQVETLPDALSELEELETLKLGMFPRLSSLPAWMEDFQHVRALWFHTCREVKSLPALDKLPRLEFLHIMQCDSLESVPPSFTRSGSFPSLKSLEWTSCKALRLFPPFEPGALPKVKVLRVDWKCCTSLPHLLASCSALWNVVLQGVPLGESFWNAVDLTNCFSRWNSIDIGYRTVDELSLFPDFVRSLPNLQFVEK